MNVCFFHFLDLTWTKFYIKSNLYFEENHTLNFLFYVTLMMLTIFSQNPALAYIDPGAGSLMVQLLIATIAGGAVASQMYWRKIKKFFLLILSKISKKQ